MDVRFVRLPVTTETLEAYAAVSAAAVVRTRLKVDALMSPDGPRFVEEPLPRPRTLDSDLWETPKAWATRTDLDRWRMLCAFDVDARAGGAVLAFEPDDHWFFPPEPGLAVLWDIRVAERHRRRGVARRLLEEAAACVAEEGYRHLAIETQDVNVAACRLYASCGAVLTNARPGAYPQHPDETALLWSLALEASIPRVS